MRYQQPEQAATQFHPMAWIGLNTVGIAASFFAGSFVGFFATEGKQMVGYAAAFILVYTLCSGRTWFLGWMERDEQIRDIDMREAQSMPNLTDTQRTNLLNHVANRSSKVVLSYVFFILPYGFWCWFWLAMGHAVPSF